MLIRLTRDMGYSEPAHAELFNTDAIDRAEPLGGKTRLHMRSGHVYTVIEGLDEIAALERQGDRQ